MREERNTNFSLIIWRRTRIWRKKRRWNG